MSDDENIITKKSENELWNIFSTIIKSLLVLLIIGFIMLWISAGGAEIYAKNGFDHSESLNPVYGLVSLIIFILINFLGYWSYNHITNRFKNYKTTISKIMFLLFSSIINWLMAIIYTFLGRYSLKNTVLEIFDSIIIHNGLIVFPIIFFIIYRKKAKDQN